MGKGRKLRVVPLLPLTWGNPGANQTPPPGGNQHGYRDKSPPHKPGENRGNILTTLRGTEQPPINDYAEESKADELQAEL